MVESWRKPGQRSVLENVPRLLEQATEERRRRVQSPRSGRRGEQGDLRAAEHHGKQFVGDATSRPDGAAALSGEELVREERRNRKEAVRIGLRRATNRHGREAGTN